MDRRPHGRAENGALIPARVYVKNAAGKFFIVKSAVAEGSAVEYQKIRGEQSFEIHTTISAHPFEAGNPRPLVTEQQPAWVNLHNNFRFIAKSTDFLWTSERSGSSQLYLHRRDASALVLSACS